MVAVSGEEAVGGTLELLTSLSHYGLDLVLGGDGEAMEDLRLEGAAGWNGLRAGPIHSGDSAPVVPAVCVFFAVDYDTRVEERRADGPEDGG